MKHIAFGLLAVALISCAQTDPDSYRKATTDPFYGRTDGLTYGLTYKEGYVENNGSRSVQKSLPTFAVSFTAEGDGEGLQCIQNDGTAYDSTALAVNLCSTAYGFTFAQIGFGTQTAGVDMDAGSLDIAGDQTDNDGVEMSYGHLTKGGRPFFVGRDGAFSTCAKVAVADVSGTDDFHIGFRKPLTATATWDDNESFFVIGWDGTAASQTLDMEQDDDGGGTTTTAAVPATTVADAETHTYCVSVSAAGVASATFDGTDLTNESFTFDDGEPLVPFISLTQANATQTGEVDLYEWRATYE